MRASRIRSIVTGLVLAFVALQPAAADAQDTAANPLLATLGENPPIITMSVTYTDGTLEPSLDRASARYIDQKLQPERRAAFDALIADRAFSPETAAERFSEYLATEDLRGRTVPVDPAGRKVDLSVVVTEVRFTGILEMAANPLSKFTALDATFALKDAETADVLASGRFRRCTTWATHIEDAKRKHDLQFTWSGTDTNFRMMTGLTSALAGCVQRLLTAQSFPVGRAQIGAAYTGSPFFLTVPITVSEPIYEIEIAAASPLPALETPTP